MTDKLVEIRQLVAAAFSDDDLKTFCFDRFPAVYHDFTAGQTQGQRVLLLVDFAARHGQLDALLDAIEKANPYQFDAFRAVVRSERGPGSQPNPFELEMVYVPAGPFLMGHAQGSGAPAWEMPQQTLALPDYHIGKYPVTNAQYLAFARDERIAVPPEAGWELATVGQVPPAGRENHPIVGITWDDAVAYCRWLSDKTGRRYRLPSEAEWEKAASWGTEVDKETGRPVNKERALRYPWGDMFDATKCNTAESGIGATTEVGVYSAKGGDSPCGAADMAGNVWEWTSTRWGTERSQPQYAPPYDPGDGRENLTRDEPFREYRIVRGGSYQDAADRATCTARGRDAANKGNPRRGFRVAMDI